MAKRKTINLTQHAATEDQRQEGVIDLPVRAQVKLRDLLTFVSLPTTTEIRARALDIAVLAAMNTDRYVSAAMIGGAPYLMPYLIDELRTRRFDPYFAFSERESEEVQDADGSVRKISRFVHKGFIPAK